MGAGAEIVLSVQEAMLSFGPLHVLGPVSFEVAAGSCVVLLGPSGCGKSTLLSALAGLQEVSSGRAHLTDTAKRPGFVFQSPNLMNWADARDNVALPLVLAGIAEADARQRATHALDVVGLGAFKQTKPRALSGGMAMRVALARALVSDPKTLLLDEPFAAIDELGRRALNDLVHKLKAERGVAILFVTHSVEEAVYMGDRILVLSARPGKIVADIGVPNVKRDSDFLLSPDFANSVSTVRRALAGVM